MERCCGDGMPTIPTEYVTYLELKARKKKEKDEKEEKDEEEEEEEDDKEKEEEVAIYWWTGIEHTSIV